MDLLRHHRHIVVAPGHHIVHLSACAVGRHLHLMQLMLQLRHPRLTINQTHVLRCIGQQVVGAPILRKPCVHRVKPGRKITQRQGETSVAQAVFNQLQSGKAPPRGMLAHQRHAIQPGQQSAANLLVARLCLRGIALYARPHLRHRPSIAADNMGKFG